MCSWIDHDPLARRVCQSLMRLFHLTRMCIVITRLSSIVFPM